MSINFFHPVHVPFFFFRAIYFQVNPLHSSVSEILFGFVRFEYLMTMTVKSTVFYNVNPVVWYKFTNVSEKYTSSIFQTEG
jgi:hypothetical protein